MVSFLTVNYRSTFFAESLLKSIPELWLKENEFVIIDNSNNLKLANKNIRIIKGTGQTHARGLEQGIKECKNNVIIFSDIDCILLDPSLLLKLVDMINNNVAMVQCIGTQFKPFHPCFGALNKDIFLKEKLTFHSQGQIHRPDDWIKFFNKHNPSKESIVYLDVGVAAAYTLLKRGYKVETIPRNWAPNSFRQQQPSMLGWWFGFDKAQVWHIVYGASPNRFLKRSKKESLQKREILIRWVLDNLVKRN